MDILKLVAIDKARILKLTAVVIELAKSFKLASTFLFLGFLGMFVVEAAFSVLIFFTERVSFELERCRVVK